MNQSFDRDFMFFSGNIGLLDFLIYHVFEVHLREFLLGIVEDFVEFLGEFGGLF